MTRTVIVHIGAALAEIAGCFSFWMWLREIRLVLMPRMANSGQATARASFP
jgi:drug/metabolite transporter superfamily protein YnfA